MFWRCGGWELSGCGPLTSKLPICSPDDAEVERGGKEQILPKRNDDLAAIRCDLLD